MIKKQDFSVYKDSTFKTCIQILRIYCLETDKEIDIIRRCSMVAFGIFKNDNKLFISILFKTNQRYKILRKGDDIEIDRVFSNRYNRKRMFYSKP